MYFRQIDLTAAQRPALLPEETLLFVQDAVGLYSGKHKLSEYQDGQAYLTSHRACYVDNAEPRKRAVAVDLKDVDHVEAYAGFLKSSPKVTLFPKASRLPLGGTGPSGTSSPSRLGSPSRGSVDVAPPPNKSAATWICPICSFSNPVPSNFDPALANDSTPLPPCLACGIKPPLATVVKAAVAAIANRGPGPGLPGSLPVGPSSSNGANTCPRCTFQNHPSLASCEICGASLSRATPGSTPPTNDPLSDRPNSPPSSDSRSALTNSNESAKFSFRSGGDKIFHERLKQALTQRKWLLQSKPKYTSGNDELAEAAAKATPPKPKAVGIAGLERRGDTLVKNNKNVIENAFEDLEALMASAKEIIALAEQFAHQARSADGGHENLLDGDTSNLLAQLNLTATKDMLSKSGPNTLYLAQLSRSLAEYLMDDTRGILRSEGGIISLVDLWAVFNRARGGVELVSPSDFAAATGLFDQLKLPVRRREFKSGLVVVQERSRTDAKTMASIVAWLDIMHADPPPAEAQLAWDWQLYGKGATAAQAADFFGWSVGVATEELEMAEDHGVVCRDAGLEGVRFWKNYLADEDFMFRFERKRVSLSVEAGASGE